MEFHVNVSSNTMLDKNSKPFVQVTCVFVSSYTIAMLLVMQCNLLYNTIIYTMLGKNAINFIMNNVDNVNSLNNVDNVDSLNNENNENNANSLNNANNGN